MSNKEVYLVTVMHEKEDLHVNEIFSNIDNALKYKKDLSEVYSNKEWLIRLDSIILNQLTPNIEPLIPSNKELFLVHHGLVHNHNLHVYEIFTDLDAALQYERIIVKSYVGDYISGFGKIVIDRMVNS